MSVVYMKIVSGNKIKKTGIGQKAAEYEGELSAASNGPWIITPAGVKSVMATLSFTAGSGKIQLTTAKIDDVINDTVVAGDIVDWGAGTVAVTTSDVFYPVTAIRMVNATGTSKITVRSQ